MTTGPTNSGTDITSRISQMKDTYRQGTARKMLAQVLKEFVSATGADLKSVDVTLPNGKKVSLLDFVKQVDRTNNLPMAYALQKVCKNPEVVAEKVIPLVEKLKSDQKCYSGADSIRITLDLRTTPAKQKNTTNIAIAQGPASPRDINNPNGIISKTGSASNIDEKENGSTITYDETWLIDKVLLRALGYGKKI
ncbi:MAG: hypothetical protein ABH860_06105 [bacterium]